MRNGPYLVKVPPISYVIFTCCENIVEVFESWTTYVCTMGTPWLSGHLGSFDALSHLILSLKELMLRVKNTFKRPKWLPNVGCDILRFDVHSLPPPPE